MLSVSWREHRGFVMTGMILLIVLGFWGCRMSQGASPALEPALAPKEPKAVEAVMIPARGDEPPAAAAGGETAKAAAATEEKPGSLVVHVSGAVKRPGVYTLKSGDRIYHAIRAAGGFKPNAWQEALNLADVAQDADQIIVPAKDDMGPPVPVRPVLSGVIPAATAAVPPPSGSVIATASASPAAPASAVKPRPRGRVLGKPLLTAQPSRPVPAAAVTVPVAAPSASGGTVAAVKSVKLKNPGDGVVNINTAGSEELQRLPGVGPATPTT